MLLDVLLLEDDPARKVRLLGFLEGMKGKLFGSVETCLCTAAAVSLLQEKQYDLLIADVLVPASLGGEPREENVIDLFEQLDEGARGIHRPTYSVAISASDGLSLEAKEFFVGRPWGILRYDEANDEFQTTIQKICEYAARERKEPKHAPHVDVVILTALPEPEFTAIEAQSEFHWAALEPLDDTQFIRYGHVAVDDTQLSVAAVFAPRMGPVATATLTTKLMVRLRPKLLVMAGICAGVPGKASIGDVVAAELAWDWQSGKYIDASGEEVFEIAPHQIHVDDRLKAALTLFKRETNFWNSLASEAARVSQVVPKLVIGPMASGSSVLADSRVTDRIRTNQHRNVVGLDMEVYAMYAAAQACNPTSMFLALKSVCDQGDRQKNDAFQNYASTISAAAVLHFIRTYARRFVADGENPASRITSDVHC